MKLKTALVFLLIGLGFGCNHEIQPQELAATVLGADNRMCAQCGGTFVRVDSTTYNADIQGYSPNTPVWIRYRIKNDLGGIKWIDVVSIRKR